MQHSSYAKPTVFSVKAVVAAFNKEKALWLRNFKLCEGSLSNLTIRCCTRRWARWRGPWARRGSPRPGRRGSCGCSRRTRCTPAPRRPAPAPTPTPPAAPSWHWADSVSEIWGVLVELRSGNLTKRPVFCPVLPFYPLSLVWQICFNIIVLVKRLELS